MKKLLRIFLLLGIVMVAQYEVSAQCTPDSTLPDSVFISPTDLPNGMVGVMYDEVISFRFPKDTIVDTLGFTIAFAFCQYSVDSVAGLPDGLTFECDKPDCIYDIDHTPGIVNRGCARISGIPTDSVINDTLEIFVKFVDGNVDMTTNVCTPQNSPILALLQPILYETRFRIDPVTTSIDDLEERLDISLFPNPAVDGASFSYELDEVRQVEIQVINLLGERVATFSSEQQLPGRHEQFINTQSLDAGIYLVQMQLDHGEGLVAKKLIVQ